MLKRKKSHFFRTFYKKRILNNDILFYSFIVIVSILAYIYLRLVMLTSHINYNIEVDKTKLKNNTYILAFWHGRLLSAFFIRKYFSKSYVLISYSRGAYLVKLVANYFRTFVVRGSKNKGGSKSIREIVTILKNKQTVFAIAPDGSIGPLMRCSTGVATISLLSKTEILPIAFSAKRGIFLKSWDRFFIPLPFNKITLHLKAPLSPFVVHKEKKAIENYRQEIENSLNNLMWELDKSYGIEQIMPKDRDKKGKLLKIKE